MPFVPVKKRTRSKDSRTSVAKQHDRTIVQRPALARTTRCTTSGAGAHNRGRNMDRANALRTRPWRTQGSPRKCGRRLARHPRARPFGRGSGTPLVGRRSVNSGGRGVEENAASQPRNIAVPIFPHPIRATLIFDLLLIAGQASPASSESSRVIALPSIYSDSASILKIL